MGSIVLKFAILVVLSCALLATNVSYDGRSIKINGESRILHYGSIHYPQSAHEMRPDLIQKARDDGLDAIETYIFWNVQEPSRREYYFEDHLNLVRFITTMQDAGLYAVLRVGPYVCTKWNYRGFPIWLHQMPDMVIRADNEIFKNKMALRWIFSFVGAHHDDVLGSRCSGTTTKQKEFLILGEGDFSKGHGIGGVSMT